MRAAIGSCDQAFIGLASQAVSAWQWLRFEIFLLDKYIVLLLFNHVFAAIMLRFVDMLQTVLY